MIIKKRPDETDENLIKRFAKKTFFEGVMNDFKRKQYFRSKRELKIYKQRRKYEQVCGNALFEEDNICPNCKRPPLKDDPEFVRAIEACRKLLIDALIEYHKKLWTIDSDQIIKAMKIALLEALEDYLFAKGISRSKEKN